jgi:hypothetical protein
MDMIYALEIFMPGSRTEVLTNFEASNPFLAVSKGDRLSPYSLPEIQAQPLLIVDVEPIISEPIMRLGLATPDEKEKAEGYTSTGPG